MDVKLFIDNISDNDTFLVCLTTFNYVMSSSDWLLVSRWA